MSISQEAFFLPVDGKQCFCVWRAPSGGIAPRGAVLHLPAFGEEMNKSRRMTALAARALAERGLGVLQLDPSGTGDSGGEFGATSFEQWIAELAVGAAWAQARAPGPLWLWALRAGALLTAPLVARVPGPVAALLWQPVQSGPQLLTHLLRQKHAAELADAGPGALEALRQQLRAGDGVEIGGYTLTGAMAAWLGAAQFELRSGALTRVAWFEVTSVTPPRLSPATRTKVAALRSDGIPIIAEAVPGPSFWQSAEIEEAPALIDVTASALTDDIAFQHA